MWIMSGTDRHATKTLRVFVCSMTFWGGVVFTFKAGEGKLQDEQNTRRYAQAARHVKLKHCSICNANPDKTAPLWDRRWKELFG